METVASPISILATRDWLDRISFATAQRWPARASRLLLMDPDPTRLDDPEFALRRLTAKCSKEIAKEVVEPSQRWTRVAQDDESRVLVRGVLG